MKNYKITQITRMEMLCFKKYIELHFLTSYPTRHENALTLCLPVSSADNSCKQFGPRSGPTKS